LYFNASQGSSERVVSSFFFLFERFLKSFGGKKSKEVWSRGLKKAFESSSPPFPEKKTKKKIWRKVLLWSLERQKNFFSLLPSYCINYFERACKNKRCFEGQKVKKIDLKISKKV
jgi:hypothetical protein